MSSKFLVNQITEDDESYFDRQQRISWWNQQKLREAKVLVVGAGAIGNESLKNIALLGVGNISIVDFDTVSKSNLSRAVLFRTNDAGKKKAEVAAQRTRDLALQQGTTINWFHGDIVWEIGTGIFSDFDLVLGCLDNVETRLFVNRQCWLANTPWIDAGIYELGCHVTVFIPPEPPCYQCIVSKEQLLSARKRYSCDDFRRSMIPEGKMPTVQVTSSLVSAIQVQEAVKILCGQKVDSGKKIYFQGNNNDFDVLNIPVNAHCTAHNSYPEITHLPLTSEATLREFLKIVSQLEYSGKGATLDYRGDRTFVTAVACKCCNRTIEMNKPSFRIFDHETICSVCAREDVGVLHDSELSSSTEAVLEFSLEKTDKKLLNMSLRDIGIPYKHILAVYNQSHDYQYYELSQDNPFTTV